MTKILREARAGWEAAIKRRKELQTTKRPLDFSIKWASLALQDGTNSITV